VSLKSTLFAAIALAGLVACGSDTTGPSLSVCGLVPPTSVPAGDISLFDPTGGPCVAVPSVPAAGTGGAEYLYIAAATAGQQDPTGILGPYSITGASLPGVTADQAPLPSPLLSAFKPALTAEQFHMMLRTRERQIAADPRAALFRASVARVPSLAASPPPQLGDIKTFFVCGNINCDQPFAQVTAEAKEVSGKVAIFVDTTVTSAQSYTAADLTNIGQLFDNYLYPIDTTNFGRESDIDGNGFVEVLMTPQINRLSGNCNVQKSVILGYFFSLDLEPSLPNSNAAEIFYSIVPDPNNTTCTIPKSFAEDNLGSTFIHEFQHMISYNRHVLVAGGQSEDTWLNEGLSHYAEELGGRLIPDAQNPLLQTGENTLGQFAFSDYDNAYNYLRNPEAAALIESDASSGTLIERGANWLMVKWLANQFGTTTPDSARFLVPSTDFTLKLENTNLLGAANVAQQAGQPFSDLVVYWQAANYLDDLPGFTPTNPRLQYVGFNLRAALAQLSRSPAFPLVPDTTSGTYSHAGTLRQGSAHHVRVLQAAGASSVQLKLSGQSGGPISPALVPRVGLVRIR